MRTEFARGGYEGTLSFAYYDRSSVKGGTHTIPINVSKDYWLFFVMETDNNTSTSSYIFAYPINKGVLGSVVTETNTYFPTISVSGNSVSVRNTNGSHSSVCMLYELT